MIHKVLGRRNWEWKKKWCLFVGDLNYLYILYITIFLKVIRYDLIYREKKKEKIEGKNCRVFGCWFANWYAWLCFNLYFHGAFFLGGERVTIHHLRFSHTLVSLASLVCLILHLGFMGACLISQQIQGKRKLTSNQNPMVKFSYQTSLSMFHANLWLLLSISQLKLSHSIPRSAENWPCH